MVKNELSMLFYIYLIIVWTEQNKNDLFCPKLKSVKNFKKYSLILNRSVKCFSELLNMLMAALKVVFVSRQTLLKNGPIGPFLKSQTRIVVVRAGFGKGTGFGF